MRVWILPAALALVAGCVSDRVIIDRKGVDMAKYDRDLAECKSYVGEVEKGREVAAETARGAVVGGLIGAAVGNRDTAGRAAGAGAVAGADRGVRKADWDKRRVLRNCLRGRGYRVLN